MGVRMTEKTPAVSVIIPTYNRAHLLGRSIHSVLGQTYKDFELIVVDDGSTDNTEEVMSNFSDDRIRYIRRMKNEGASVARNTGIEIARGEYIAFQDSDDEWLPEKLEKQVTILEKAPPEVGVVYTGLHRLKNNRKVFNPSSNITPKEGDVSVSLLKGNFVSPQTMLIKRECLEKAGIFDERFHRMQGWDFNLRVSRYYHFRCIDEPLVISYFQTDSISANQDAFITALELILLKYSEDFRKDSRALSRQYLILGHNLCCGGELERGRSYFMKAVRVYPLSIESMGAILASWLGESSYRAAATSYQTIRDWFGQKKAK